MSKALWGRIQVKGGSRGVVGGLALVALGLAVAAPAAAQNVICKQGQGCIDAPRGYTTFTPDVPDPDPQGILPILIAEAEVDPRAAFDLGMRYMRGDGIARDPFQAIQWMRRAGEGGNVQAQAALGKLYLSGLEEMGADYFEAVSWLERAAGNGDRESRELLVEARELEQDERAWQSRWGYWRQRYTSPYWYSTRYYGYWRNGLYYYY
ncbi:MAG: tetratricopeptide repeat protein [Pseudomonadota bacterium]